VNAEFAIANAKVEAEKYAEAIGRLPKCLRTLLKDVTIQGGLQPFGGGN